MPRIVINEYVKNKHPTLLGASTFTSTFLGRGNISKLLLNLQL